MQLPLYVFSRRVAQPLQAGSEIETITHKKIFLCTSTVMANKRQPFAEARHGHIEGAAKPIVGQADGNLIDAQSCRIPGNRRRFRLHGWTATLIHDIFIQPTLKMRVF